MSMSVDVEKLGARCGRDAVDAAGSKPWDSMGRSLLPPAPLGGDWDALHDALEREPTDEHLDVFERAFRGVIEDGRGRLFGARVRHVREQIGATQSALADILQVAPNTVARWERSELTPPRSAEAGVILQLRELQQRRWAKQEHRANEYDALAREALEGEGFTPDTAAEVARVCRNTADSIREEQQNGDCPERPTDAP